MKNMAGRLDRLAAAIERRQAATEEGASWPLLTVERLWGWRPDIGFWIEAAWLVTGGATGVFSDLAGRRLTPAELDGVMAALPPARQGRPRLIEVIGCLVNPDRFPSREREELLARFDLLRTHDELREALPFAEAKEEDLDFGGTHERSTTTRRGPKAFAELSDCENVRRRKRWRRRLF